MAKQAIHGGEIWSIFFHEYYEACGLGILSYWNSDNQNIKILNIGRADSRNRLFRFLDWL